MLMTRMKAKVHFARGGRHNGVSHRRRPACQEESFSYAGRLGALRR